MREKDVYNDVTMIRFEEGLRLRPYKCTGGALTIGVGRNLDANGITEQEAGVMLATDMERARSLVLQAFPWSAELHEARQAVLVSMCFQMGIAGLKKFKRTLRSIREGRYDDAADQMLESLWARQTPNRAQRHARQMREGRWPCYWGVKKEW